MEQSKNYVEAIIGSSVGAVAILAMLVLLILYKRRTRERPTPYWPNTSNRSDDGAETVIIESAQDSSINEDINDHHYTLPKTTSSCVKMVNLVRPALKKTTDVRAWASEADLCLLPYQCSERPHRGLCFTTSVGSKSGAVSAPDIHIYETIEPCNSTYHRENTGRCKNCKTISKPYCQTDGDHGYIEFFATSGAASAPDLHLYEELKPCSCIDKLGKACNCIKYTSLRLQSNP
ncbi:hypothetical protein KP79_PYT24249 [Mizuhopecten yessoensis]|uniref:Uncharacterized protein n=2 Tax=Mizuhopecten yessoensis TaxID=6573 RepID=A0A210QRC1_MIZYE|nr:hypothetical protein KP79_PYT24249 [Mizuhopecten yessoensis]